MASSGPLNLKRYEIVDSKIIFYFDEISSNCFTCVEFLAYQEFKVKNLKEKLITVYDYYEPSYRAFANYVHIGSFIGKDTNYKT